MATDQPVPIPADTRVTHCPDCAVGARWPTPVHHRLEAIVELARDFGESTTHKELLAAIVCAFEPDEDAIGAALRTYRRSTAGQIALTAPDGENVLRLARKAQGRPRRASG